MLRNGREIEAIFQAATPAGAAIRVGFDGEQPLLPAMTLARREPPSAARDGLWPDETYFDD